MYTKVYTLIITAHFSSLRRRPEIQKRKKKEAKVSYLCSSIRQAFTARFIHFPLKTLQHPHTATVSNVLTATYNQSVPRCIFSECFCCVCNVHKEGKKNKETERMRIVK